MKPSVRFVFAALALAVIGGAVVGFERHGRAQLAEPDKMPRDQAQELRADLLELNAMEPHRRALLERVEQKAKLYRLDRTRPIEQQVNYETGEIARPQAVPK